MYISRIMINCKYFQHAMYYLFSSTFASGSTTTSSPLLASFSSEDCFSEFETSVFLVSAELEEDADISEDVWLFFWVG